MARSTSKTPSKRTKKRRLIKIVLTILVVLIAIRLALPYVVVHFLNKRLAEISGYFGHLDDVNLAIYRGAYTVRGLYINKVDSMTQKQTPLLLCPEIDISIEWASLFKGRIVSELEFANPTLQFTEDAAEPEEMEKDTNDFHRMLKTFTPFKVNRFEVFDGKIAYLDKTVTPVVDIQLDRAHILARNLGNVVDTTLLPANIEASAEVYGGSLKFNMRADALADDPTYDMNVEIQNAQLVKLNDFFKAYAKFDVNKGTFGMYMEVAAKDRKYIGYVKPFLKDLDISGPEDKEDSILRRIWEGLVQIAGELLENRKTEEIATKIPILGEYGEETVGVWYAIFAVLRNGFIQAIYPALDYQVTIGTVEAVKPEEKKEGIFKRVFGKPGKTKQDRKKEQENAEKQN